MLRQLAIALTLKFSKAQYFIEIALGEGFADNVELSEARPEVLQKTRSGTATGPSHHDVVKNRYAKYGNPVRSEANLYL